jgi:hypothetical protein
MPKATVNFKDSEQTPFEILMEQRRFNVTQNRDLAVA